LDPERAGRRAGRSRRTSSTVPIERERRHRIDARLARETLARAPEPGAFEARRFARINCEENIAPDGSSDDD
jgi:hypothetical protein